MGKYQMVIFHIKASDCSSCIQPIVSVTIVILFAVISFVQHALYFQLLDLLGPWCSSTYIPQLGFTGKMVVAFWIGGEASLEACFRG